MSDTITLPRELAEKIFDAFSSEVYPPAGSTEWYDIMDALRTALAAPRPEPEKRHPGYIIGNHWLETAYSRVCMGEAEADVLRDCGWQRVADIDALLRDVEALWRDAERYRWMKREVKRIPPAWDLVGWDAAIDAAMQEVPR